VEVTTMPNPVVHFEIGAQNADKVRAFYAALFDWHIDATNPSYDLIPESNGGIGGGIMQIREGMHPYVTIYVGVDDLDATLKRVAELGGHHVFGPMPVPEIGEFAMFTDPEGHLIGLFRKED
jgi:predicted enzyme related to lactoylglutathione lyase